MNKIMRTTLALLMLGLMLFSTVSFALINSVSALTIDSVAVADEIQPGKTTRITMGIENDAQEDVEDVSITLDLSEVPFAPFDSASEYSIDEIDEDDTEFAEFEVIALNNAQAGIYKIPVSIKYIQNGDDRSKNSLISIVVDSKPEIEASIEDSLLLKGKDNEFFIKVTNKGLSDAKFVEIKVGEGQYNILEGSSQYIGDIDSDDFDSVKVKAYFDKGVGNDLNIPVTLIYKDDLNKEYSDTFNLNLKVYTEDKAVELGLMEKSVSGSYIIGIVFIIILYLVYRRLKNKLKNKVRK